MLDVDSTIVLAHSDKQRFGSDLQQRGVVLQAVDRLTVRGEVLAAIEPWFA